MSLDQLKRLRLGVRAALALALAVSLAANVLHASEDPISRAISAWPPLALMLTIELISRVPATSRALSAARLVAAAIIALIAAWVSYWHMAAVAATYGEASYGAQYLWPLTVDGLAVVASICLVEIGGRLSKLASDASTSVATPELTRAGVAAGPELGQHAANVANNMAAEPELDHRGELATEPGQREATVAKEVARLAVTPDVDTEVASWMASTNGQREVQVAKTVVATRRQVATYDQAKAKARVRQLMDRFDPELAGRELDKAKGSVDAAVAKEFGVSTRTARRLRGQVSGEPISGPPADVADGHTDSTEGR